MVAVLAYRVYKRWTGLTDKDPQSNALRQLLPLVAYPIIFCVCTFPSLVNRLYNAINATPSQTLQVITSISISVSSLAAGMVLITQISVSKFKRWWKTSKLTSREDEEAVNNPSLPMLRSTTHFSHQTESVSLS